MSVKKAELVKNVAETVGLSVKDTAKAVGSFLEFVQKELQTGNAINIVGFGKFKVKDRAARIGFNPKTREKIEISAKKAPVFRAGKTFKKAILEAL